jgi:hypothetical protein
MARRVRPSHLVLALGAAYLLLVSLKFRRVLDLATADLAGDPAAAFSSPSSSDHLPPGAGASSHNATATSTRAATAAAFPVQPFWHRYDRVSLPDPAASRGGRTALDRMADDAWALGLAAWEEAAAFAGDPWALLVSTTARLRRLQVPLRTLLALPCGLAAGSSVTVVGEVGVGYSRGGDAPMDGSVMPPRSVEPRPSSPWANGEGPARQGAGGRRGPRATW